MKKVKEKELDFIIDKLTNSIRNTISGDSFQTEISRFTIKDVNQTIKKNGWNFDWKAELKDYKKEVFKLTLWRN